MKAEAKSLTFLANEGSVQIPFFQRAYVWNEDNWEELISDLLQKDKSHFLGSLILKQVDVPIGSSKQVVVIDGQQRLTTLSILLRALFNSFDEELQQKCKQDGKFDVCLFYKKDMFESEICVKIEHSKIDKQHYQAVIKNEKDPATIDPGNCESNVLKCFKYFTERLQQVNLEDRKRLFSDLLNPNNEILVVIGLSEADDEQSIFDTINSAGVRLSSADIVKNTLFQRAFNLYGYGSGKVEDLYKENWESVFASDEQSITFWGAERTWGRFRRDNIEILLHSIAVIEGFFDPEKNTLTDLANIYKVYINGLNSEEYLKFIDLLTVYARLYREKMLVFTSSDLFGFNDYQERLFHILNVCEISTFHPYILFLYKKYAGDPVGLKETLKKLETMVIRRFICNSETKNYNKLCKDFIGDHRKIDKVLEDTPDNAFRNALLKINNKQAALLLFWVELYRRNKDKRYDRDELKYTYTLEHLMPQKWEEFWSNIPVIGDDGCAIADPNVAKQYRYRWIYSIGNMTLLKSSLNSALRNYEFTRKVEGENRKRGIRHYAELGITKFDVVEPFDAGSKVWDEARIRERTKQISDDVLAIWCL